MKAMKARMLGSSSDLAGLGFSAKCPRAEHREDAVASVQMRQLGRLLSGHEVDEGHEGR